MDEPMVTPWRPWEAVPVALAALCASLVVAAALAAAGVGVGGIPLLVTAIVLQASFVGFSLAWVGVRHRSGLAALGLRSTRATRDLAVGGWSGVALFAVVAFGILPAISALWTALTGGPPGPIDQGLLPTDPTPVHIVLGMIAAVIAAPLGEEVFFRGFLFGSLRGRLGFWRASAISAAVFAIFHGIPLLMVLMFFVGIALAWLYERRGSLVAPIGAHAMFNVIGYALLLMYGT